MSKEPAHLISAEDGTETAAEELPILRAESGIARVWLQDGTELTLTVHIAQVLRGIIDRGDRLEVIHSVKHGGHLDVSGPPPEILEQLSTDSDDTPAALNS